MSSLSSKTGPRYRHVADEAEPYDRAVATGRHAGSMRIETGAVCQVGADSATVTFCNGLKNSIGT